MTADAIAERRVWIEPTSLRRVRVLPVEGQVLFREQRSVRIDDVVARAERPKPPLLLSISRALRVNSGPVEPYLLRRPGDDVAAGEVIARISGPLGTRKRECVSPVDGQLVSGPSGSGDYLVVPKPEVVELAAHYPGVVGAVIPQRGIVVQTTAVGAQGLAGFGGEGGGAIRVVSGAIEPISPGRLVPRLAGAVVVGGNADLSTLRRAVALGLGGVVVGSLPASVFAAYQLEEKTVPLLIVDGFGSGGMSPFVHDLFRRHEGLEARITTGVPPLGLIRGEQPPEILVAVNSAEPLRDRPLTLKVGSRARVVAGLDDVADGLVREIGDKPMSFAPGLAAKWVEVVVDGKQPIRVPLVNVELMADPIESGSRPD
jgi:hypothetical protein